jgi:CheY-like chemotaxis protein
VSLPHLLLVDDSEAILSFEKAALSSHYTLSTATTGREALLKVRELRPDALLLDLSMPEMDGDEVLREVKADPELAGIPVIVVTSEKHRAEACLKAGADAFVPKPIQADELSVIVGRVLSRARSEARRGSLRVLFLGVGELTFGVPLEAVESAVQMPATSPLPGGPSYLREYAEIYGEPVCVMDLAARLSVSRTQRRVERKLVVIRNGEEALALDVDRVDDPEELPSEDVVPRSRLGGTEHPVLRELLVAIARTPRGFIPVVDPRALLSTSLWRELRALLAPPQEGRARAP